MKYTIAIDTELFSSESYRIKPSLEVTWILRALAYAIDQTGQLNTGHLMNREGALVGTATVEK